MNLIKATKEVCARCKYHGGTDAETLNDVYCNYLSVVGHSRIFEKGQRTYPAEYCNKFAEGPSLTRSAADHRTSNKLRGDTYEEVFQRDGHIYLRRNRQMDPDNGSRDPDC